ncbi:LEA type 2 family protein [Polaribacter sp. Asnod6-C07]|uniref:LEA type 2 family protein n=1 Tax=Polaribacter sp. Asnod6-C07 TaxID=3160582 RepID=UPI00386F4F20
MKKAFYFLALFLFFYSCSVKKQPIFIKIDDVKIVSFAADTLKLRANAFFENPNDVGGKISTDDIAIFVNDIEIAQVFSDEFKVPARDKFTIPLTANVPTKKLLNSDKNGVLGGLINSFITKKVNVRIKGNLEYVVFGFKKEFIVDKTEEIKIKF